MSVASAKTPYFELPTVTATAVASGTATAVVNRVLPEGKYLITGTIQVSGTLTDVTVTNAIRTLFKETAAVTVINAPIAFQYQSNGTTGLTITLTPTTSSGTWTSTSTILEASLLNC